MEVLAHKYKIQIQEVPLYKLIFTVFIILEIKNLYYFFIYMKRLIKTQDKEIGFYLLHLPWQVLIEQVERLKLKIPLKVNFYLHILIKIKINKQTK